MDDVVPASASPEWIRFTVPGGRSVRLDSSPDLAPRLHVHQCDEEDPGSLLSPVYRPTGYAVDLDILLSPWGASPLSRLRLTANEMIRQVHDLLAGSVNLIEFSIDAETASPDGQRARLTVPRLHVTDFEIVRTPERDGWLAIRYLRATLHPGGDGNQYQVKLIGQQRHTVGQPPRGE